MTVLTCVSAGLSSAKPRDDPRAGEAGDRDRLADEEALRLPVKRLRARERDAAVAVGATLTVAGDLHRDVRIQRALDVERVVALAEQHVEDLDRATSRRRWRTAPSTSEIEPKLMPPGKIAGSPNVCGCRSSRPGRSRGRRPCRGPTASSRSACRGGPDWLPSLKTLRTSICLDSRRLRADREQRRRPSRRELEAELQRAVGAGDAALDGERAAQLGEQVRGDREDLHALAR